MGIKLNARSQTALRDLAAGYKMQHALNFNEPVPLEVLLNFLKLKHEKSQEDLEFLRAIFALELLTDIHNSLHAPNADEITMNDPHWTIRMKYILLAIAGTILAGCEGFDSITAMMDAVALPSIVILFSGSLFSLLAIIVFYGFDLVEVAKNLEIKVQDSPKLLDIKLAQLHQMKHLRKTILALDLSDKNLNELQELHTIVLFLKERLEIITYSGKQFQDALNQPQLTIGKVVVSAIAGLLFFGSGFFAGQSVALFLSNLLIVSGTTPLIPVILFSVLVGCSAFSLYWHVQRPGLQRLLSHWFGLNEDKIDELCNTKKMAIELQKLETIDKKLMKKLQNKSAIEKPTPTMEPLTTGILRTKRSLSINSFFPRDNSPEIDLFSELSKSRVNTFGNGVASC